MKQNLTELVFILDRSGSMAGLEKTPSAATRHAGAAAAGGRGMRHHHGALRQPLCTAPRTALTSGQ